MDELQVLNIGGVDCYEKDGKVYLKLETVASRVRIYKRQERNKI